MAKKNELLQSILEYSMLELATAESSDDEAEDRILDELEEHAAIFAGLRYMHRGTVPKNMTWFDETLPNLDDKRFKIFMRCTRQQFNVILALIETHPVFHGINSEKQFTPAFQLALVLYRLGSFGDGSTLAKIAALFGVGDGGTIGKVTSRVFEAILSLENEFISWPSADERNEIVVNTFNELPHCVGYMDGTEIPLLEKPGWDHTSYYSRNKQYSIKTQAVCDPNIRVRQMTVGYPGCAHDARIFNNCRLATHSQEYFSELEYLAADSAYGLSSTVITPFRENATVLTAGERRGFNKYFSSYRVRVEHLFAIVKERFPSLYGLPVRVSDVESHKLACSWIRVCFILHNILLPYFDEDDWTYNLNILNQPIVHDEDYEEQDILLEQRGEIKRIALAQLITQN